MMNDKVIDEQHITVHDSVSQRLGDRNNSQILGERILRGGRSGNFVAQENVLKKTCLEWIFSLTLQ